MIDRVAEQYVILWSKTVFFLENPTSCNWIDFFQALFVLATAGWILRTARATWRGKHVVGESIGLEARRDGEETEKLRRAFLRARHAISRTMGSAPLGLERLRICPRAPAFLGNVGLLRPRVLIAPDLIRRLDDEELTAALAHELAHVLRNDNRKRVALEVGCLLTPFAIWAADGLHLAVSSSAEFLAVLFLGLLSALVLRALAVPAVTYWQERRADEWAALACGDRLAVASALVAAASASSEPGTRLKGLPATSFAFYNTRVSSRVRRLLETEKDSRVTGIDRLVMRISRLGAVAFVLVLGLAVHRAESQGLSGIIQITGCDVTLRVERPPESGPVRSVSSRGCPES